MKDRAVDGGGRLEAGGEGGAGGHEATAAAPRGVPCMGSPAGQGVDEPVGLGRGAGA